MEKTIKILIVDDFASIRKVIADTLKRYGFSSVEAENGKHALEVLTTTPDIDLVLSDFNMPEMNGLELLQAIKSNDNFAHLPFILLTSETNRQKMVQAKEAGLDAWIQKPYKIEAFITQIKYCIEKRTKDVTI